MLRAHFQGEDGHRLLLIDRDVLRDVHGERGLAHGRPRGDDDHLRAVQAIGHLVEIGEARGQPGDAAPALVEILDGADRRP